MTAFDILNDSPVFSMLRNGDSRMPWTGPQFKERHNSSLTAAEAEKAAVVANAVLVRCLEAGGSAARCEAKAIRIANAAVGRWRKKMSQVEMMVLSAETPEVELAKDFKHLVIKEGCWLHPRDGQRFLVDEARLDEFVDIFGRCRERQIEVPITRGHDTSDPGMVIGQWAELWKEKGSDGRMQLWGRASVEDEAIIPKIGKTIKHVSIGVRPIYDCRSDGTTELLGVGIDHIAVTPRPVFAGREQGNFVALSNDGKETTLVVMKEVIEMTDGELLAQLEGLGAELAVWTAKYVNDLPDSCFLYIEPGGSKDQSGRTKPRSLRHFPYRNANGQVDTAHLANALARIPQSNLPQAVKDRVIAKAKWIARSYLKTYKMELAMKEVPDLAERVAGGVEAARLRRVWDLMCSAMGEVICSHADDEADQMREMMADLVEQFSKLLGRDQLALVAPFDSGQEESVNSQLEGQKGLHMDIAKVAEMFGLAVEGLTQENLLDQLHGKVEADKAAIKPGPVEETAEYKALMDQNKSLNEVILAARKQLAKATLAGLAGRIRAAEDSGRIAKAQKDILLGTFSLDYAEDATYDEEWSASVEQIAKGLNLVESLQPGAVVKRRVVLAQEPVPSEDDAERQKVLKDRIANAGCAALDADNQVYDPVTGWFKVKPATS